jgi:bisphosphoglycerate-dependent phosphoglycerate mutase
LDYLRTRGLFEDLNKNDYVLFCKGIKNLFEGKPLLEEENAFLDIDNEYKGIRGESLKDAMLRMKKWLRIEYLFWEEGDSILIVTHGNWLRGVIKMLDQLTNEQVLNYNIPTASPILYDLVNLEVVKKEYLEEEETLKKRSLSVFQQVK